MKSIIPGSFEKTKKAIELLVKNDVPVQISCPIMKANQKCYSAVMDYARSLKIKAQTDFIMITRNRRVEDKFQNAIRAHIVVAIQTISTIMQCNIYRLTARTTK